MYLYIYTSLSLSIYIYIYICIPHPRGPPAEVFEDGIARCEDSPME